MQLKELSELTGTSAASIKYYLREGLLPPGESVHATRASYTRAHVDRLELIRSLRQIVGLSIEQIRSIVKMADDGVPHLALLAHVQSVVLKLGTGGGEVGRTSAADAVVRMRDWPDVHSDARDALNRHISRMQELGIELPPDLLDQYSSAVDSIAGFDLTATTRGQDTDRIILTAAVGMHMHSELMLKLLALAQASHAIRRLTITGDP
ncbi:transcriptional regulator, MerR family [Pseudarthrobacter chlorophenolicus A6]|uniref:Transcriptional regulator, MerR family n=1 Tax=Pseudarthrobacter chlorophenolicus (strain ATCC 700700 / DSM 12829 / CIP 107037 / JCM 12360 / KCTC 9906 / NCIMB 13794 / A6) TaxID=452863 RepID=B8HCG2_PSECP|nr:MerR family transcriptional regulator [Pseudarthrobacter chlorophenolicus]ACL40578.1 transcriptional regulator, MerR family [Pseudarthrobacter chlorophenolicus A6]SDQ79006.1 MerR HTH family regulatory protein [Pseudarthrobacter chlorophenolicus]